MYPLRVFVSFDVDHDFDLLELLATQAGEPESSFVIADWSGRESAAGDENASVRDRVRQVDYVIFICGELTHHAGNVSDELTIAHEENKPYVLLWGRKGRLITSPASATPADRVHEWSRTVLEKQIKVS